MGFSFGRPIWRHPFHQFRSRPKTQNLVAQLASCPNVIPFPSCFVRDLCFFGATPGVCYWGDQPIHPTRFTQSSVLNVGNGGAWSKSELFPQSSQQPRWPTFSRLFAFLRSESPLIYSFLISSTNWGISYHLTSFFWIYIYMCVYMYMYIYIYVCMYVYIYIYHLSI